jgi:hypothetical protein
LNIWWKTQKELAHSRRAERLKNINHSLEKINRHRENEEKKYKKEIERLSCRLLAAKEEADFGNDGYMREELDKSIAEYDQDIKLQRQRWQDKRNSIDLKISDLKKEKHQLMKSEESEVKYHSSVVEVLSESSKVASKDVETTAKVQHLEDTVSESIGVLPNEVCVGSCKNEGGERKGEIVKVIVGTTQESGGNSEHVATGGVTGSNNVGSFGFVKHIIEQNSCSANRCESVSLNRIESSDLAAASAEVGASNMFDEQKSQVIDLCNDPDELIPGCSSCGGLVEKLNDVYSTRKTMNFRRYGPWRVLRDRRFSTVKKSVISSSTRRKTKDELYGHWREFCEKRFSQAKRCASIQFVSFHVMYTLKLLKGRYQVRSPVSNGGAPSGKERSSGANSGKTGGPQPDDTERVDSDWFGFHGYRTKGFPQTGQPPGEVCDIVQSNCFVNWTKGYAQTGQPPGKVTVQVLMKGRRKYPAIVRIRLETPRMDRVVTLDGDDNEDIRPFRGYVALQCWNTQC